MYSLLSDCYRVFFYYYYYFQNVMCSSFFCWENMDACFEVHAYLTFENFDGICSWLLQLFVRTKGDSFNWIMYVEVSVVSMLELYGKSATLIKCIHICF